MHRKRQARPTEEVESALAASRQLSEARIAVGEEGYEPQLDMALVNAIEGNTEESLRCLRKAFDAGGVYVLWILTFYDMITEALAEDPEYQQLMKEYESKKDEVRRRVEALEKESEPR